MSRKSGLSPTLLSKFSRSSQETICWRCRSHINRRGYASAGLARAESSQQSDEAQQAKPSTVASPRSTYQIRASVILSRAPQITRDLTAFEKSFYLYQRRLNERLALPFTKYFYFRRDTPSELEWRRKMKLRQSAARDIGNYNPYSETGWDDELRVGAKESEPEHQMEALLDDAKPPKSNAVSADAETGPDGQVPTLTSENVARPASRVTEADNANDQKSLNRALPRTLYLLVNNGKDEWVFPSGGLIGNESLHLAAERVLVQSGGLNMNTWVIGNAPIGHLSEEHKQTVTVDKTTQELGQRTFFMKARIFTGQADLQQNKFGLSDFRWLVKEEVQQLVAPRYWQAVRNVLADR